MMDVDFAVKYPFSRTAKQMIAQSGLSLTDRIIEKGLERIKNALKGKIPPSAVIHPNDKLEEVASYAAARIILGSMRNRYLSNRYAIAEAKRAGSLITDSDIAMIGDEMGVVAEVDEGGGLNIGLVTYLKFSPKSIDYKLINREVKNGRVRINRHEWGRLIEEAVRKYVERMPLVKNPADNVKKAAEKLKEFLPKIEVAKIDFKDGTNPPCIEKIIENLRKHENLSHQMRWILAVYLVNKGMENEKIVNMFSNLPDFSERISRYQIEHVRKRGYSMPTCATMLSYGLCVANCNIGNPMKWRPGLVAQKRGE